MSTEYTRYFSALTDYTNNDPIDDRDIDGEFDQIKDSLNAKVLIKATAPSTPIEGQTWIDSTNKVFKIYRNGKWANLELSRQFTIPQTKDDVAAAGTLLESFLVFPKRAKIVGFGIMSAASDVVLATDDTFEIRTINGTKLGTFVADADYTLASGYATSQSLETATAVATNVPLVCCVGTNIGVSGSVYYFADWYPD